MKENPNIDPNSGEESPRSSQNGIMECLPRAWWVRLILRCFAWHPPQGMTLPDWAKDRLTVHTEINFSGLDRLLILLTGRVDVRSLTDVENPPGLAVSESSVVVRPPRWVEEKFQKRKGN